MQSDDDDVLHLYDLLTPRKNGKSTEPVGLIYSAHLGTNAEVFPSILKLHVKDGARIADVTYGRGGFWKFVAKGRYETLFSDLFTGSEQAEAKVQKFDCRKLPYDASSCDAVVFDPPSTIASETDVEAQDNHEAVIGLYVEAACEAVRVLKKRGVLVVRCQDEGDRRRLTHVGIINEYEKLGFYCDDLFVVVQTSLPTASRLIKQRHARKVHGYLLVFRVRST